jgi:large subunit ribosomal protein L20
VPRVRRSTNRRDSRKKTLQLASGYFLTKSKLYRSAQEAVEKALRYGYVGRKRKKRDYRRLFIVRINAGCRLNATSYSKFIGGLKKAGIELNRKILADLAANEPAAFTSLVEKAKAALAAA